MTQRETVGALAYKASHDSTIYDAIEVGYALTEDIARELMVCAHRHKSIFDEDQYCVGYVISSDPLIQGVMRRKFFAFLYLPSPRPNQAIFLYDKRADKFIKRLWTLPNAWTMACLSELTTVDPKFKEMKSWCDAFYNLNFWETIRKQQKITMLSESEYLNDNREKLIQAGCKEISSPLSDPFDFSKIALDKIIDTNQTGLNQ